MLAGSVWCSPHVLYLYCPMMSVWTVTFQELTTEKIYKLLISAGQRAAHNADAE